MHCDKHVVKMILEATQMLSTAHRLLDGTETVVQKVTATGKTRNVKRWVLSDDREGLLYSATHANHPCTIWTRETSGNYRWHWELLVALCAEYRVRYGEHKTHKVEASGLMARLETPPSNITEGGMTSFAVAMPDEYRTTDPVESYRAYYLGAKRAMLNYRNREEPDWIV